MSVAVPIIGAFLAGLLIEYSNPDSDLLAYGFILLAVFATLFKISDYRMIWNHINDKRFPMRWSILINVAMHIVIFSSIFIAAQQLDNNNSYSVTYPTNRPVDAMYHTTDIFAQVGSGGSSPKNGPTKVIATVQLLDAYAIAILAATLLIVPLVRR
jgi:hypothetical protein